MCLMFIQVVGRNETAPLKVEKFGGGTMESGNTTGTPQKYQLL